MTIDKRTVAVATCDSCAHQEYANEYGHFSAGYEVTVIEHDTGTQHTVIACRQTHIAKAVRNVLGDFRAEHAHHEPSAITPLEAPLEAP